MTELLFTTNDVAQMLQVEKSTVRRWTDEGKLRCSRTPGGHRKFRAEDLYRFMVEYSYAISPTDVYSRFASDDAVIRRMIAEKDYRVLSSVCFSSALKGNKAEILKLFSETYHNGLSSAQILTRSCARPGRKLTTCSGLEKWTPRRECWRLTPFRPAWCFFRMPS